MLPVEPEEVDRQRTKDKVKPERVIETEIRDLGADVRVRRRHQSKRGEGYIHQETGQHHGRVEDHENVTRMRQP